MIRRSKLIVSLLLVTGFTVFVPAVTASDTTPEQDDLQQTIEELRVQLAEQEERIGELENEEEMDRPVHPTIDRLRTTVSELKKTIRRQEEKLAEYRNLTKEQKQELRQARQERQEKMEELQEKLSDVKEAETQRQGKEMTITLDNAILFPLGKSQLKESAKSTLNKVTDPLDEYDNYRILVEGHTDNVPVDSERFSSNWSLSAQRAVNVTEYLDENTPISGERLVAAGLGKYRPVVPNQSSENREKNRRVEIKLIPTETLQAEEKLSSEHDTESTE
jgi:chemotaxis protein MotB